LKKVMDIADAADGATWWENDGMSCSSWSATYWITSGAFLSRQHKTY
jgi:hypothetical protein